jgi:alkylhydroperoxidase family enzyme
VDDQVIETLKEEFSDQNLVELTVTVSVANLTNRINNGLNIPLEE